MADIAKIIDEIKGMTVLELNELVKAIEEEFGVSAAATAVAVAGPAGDAAGGDDVAEKDSYTVVLSEVGPSKMNVIKAVKEITGLSLKESKEIVDGAPKTLKEGASQSEAEEIQKVLKEAGATVELK